MMPLTIRIELTDAQTDVMLDVARSVLPDPADRAAKVAWATQVARDGLVAELERVGVCDIDNDARVVQHAARSAFLASVAAAFAVS